MKKILITGGAGFIGSHLAEELIRAGHEVYVLDDLSTGSLENIRALENEPRFHFVLGSVLDRAVVAELIHKCEEVFHLAAVVGVKLVVEDPIKTMNVNVLGTENILTACLTFNRKVLIVSTSEVYGKDIAPEFEAFKESHDLSLGPSLRWSYACSKALDEYMAISYHRKKGLPLVVSRIFNTVGPRQTGAYGMVLPRFVGQALSGQPITVYGDGEQVRSFILVDDTVRALLGLMKERAVLGEIFNVGGEEKVRIKDVAERIKVMTGSASPIVHIPYAQAYGSDFEDIRFRVPDITKIRQAIGFRPGFTLDQILERIIAFHQARQDRTR